MTDAHKKDYFADNNICQCGKTRNTTHVCNGTQVVVDIDKKCPCDDGRLLGGSDKGHFPECEFNWKKADKSVCDLAKVELCGSDAWVITIGGKAAAVYTSIDAARARASDFNAYYRTLVDREKSKCLPQRQDSLIDQIHTAISEVNRIGCYDAADWIKRVFFRPKAAEYGDGLGLVEVLQKVDKFLQSNHPSKGFDETDYAYISTLVQMALEDFNGKR